MKRLVIILFLIPTIVRAEEPTGKEILERIDKNLAAKSTITTSKMIIHGARQTRTIEAKTWGIGEISFGYIHQDLTEQYRFPDICSVSR